MEKRENGKDDGVIWIGGEREQMQKRQKLITYLEQAVVQGWVWAHWHQGA